MDPEPELVSIILPTYNRAHLLPDAINSVLNQTYPYWELIIWDDGSTDDTKSVLAALKDTRVKCYREENHGMSYALNKGLELAKGDLIAFLDDDDTWLPEKLAIQVSVMEKFPQVDLVFGNFLNTNIEDSTQNLGFDQGEGSLAKLLTDEWDEDIWLITQGFLEGIAMDNFIAFDTVVTRRSVFESIGNFNENLRSGMDFEFWWRFGLADLNVAFTTEILLNRVKYPGSLSGRSVSSMLNRLEMLYTCKELAIGQNRVDLVGILSPLYRNTWHNLIAAYGKEKDFKKAYSAFRHSLDYGFRPGALRLLAKALINTFKR